jgi:hypothetical protein
VPASDEVEVFHDDPKGAKRAYLSARCMGTVHFPPISSTMRSIRHRRKTMIRAHVPRALAYTASLLLAGTMVLAPTGASAGAAAQTWPAGLKHPL